MFLVFLGCSRFLGGVPGFLGVFLVFLGCSRFFGGVPGFLGVFQVFWGCSWFFRCSGMFRDVPVFRCSGVPVFLEVLHAIHLFNVLF